MTTLALQVEFFRGSFVQHGPHAITDETIDAAIEVADRLDGVPILGRLLTLATPTPGGGVELSDESKTVSVSILEG